MPSVFVGMPSNWTPYPETIFNIFYQDCREFVDIYFDMNSLTIRQPIQIARNELLRRFIEDTDCDYLWFCDDDNPPSIDVLQKLINANKDIVSAIVPLRMWDNEGDLLNIFYYDEFGSRQHYKDISNIDQQVIEIANCWTWCVLLSRDFCKAMYDAYDKTPFAFEKRDYVVTLKDQVEKYEAQDYESNRKDTYKEDYNGQIRIVSIPLSEDVCFFEKAKLLGYKLYADVSSECYHFNSRPNKRRVKWHFIPKD